MALVQIPFDKATKSKLRKIADILGLTMTSYVKMVVSKNLLEDEAKLIKLSKGDFFTEEEIKKLQ